MQTLERFAALAVTGLAVTDARAADTVARLEVGAAAVLVLGLAAGLLAILLLKPALLSLGKILRSHGARRRLMRAIEASGGRCLSGFVLPGLCSGLTQIDHAVVTAGGVVCIMHRSYRGTIFGDVDASQWTSIDGLERRQFMNPIVQNRARAAALEKALPGVPVQSLVVFDDGAEFASSRPTEVVDVRSLAETLERIDFDARAVEDQDSLWLNLRSVALTDESSRKDLGAQVSFG